MPKAAAFGEDIEGKLLSRQLRELANKYSVSETIYPRLILIKNDVARRSTTLIIELSFSGTFYLLPILIF